MDSQRASWNYRQQIVKFLESTRNKTYTIVGLTFMALILFGAFAIRPTIATIFKLQNKIESGRRIEKNMQAKIDTLTNLQQLLYQYEKKIDYLEEVLNNKPHIDTIIANTQLIAEEYDLEVRAIEPVEGSEENYLGEDETGLEVLSKGLNLSLTGKREDLQKFIDHFERHPRIVYVDKLGFTTNEEREEDLLQSTIYFFYTAQ